MINIALLRKYCKATESECAKIANATYNPVGNYWFNDRKASILGVAHLDISGGNCKAFTLDKEIIISRALDDRLGAYLVGSYLPSIGARIDTLFTTDEETGNSTSQFFSTERSYNWIFSMDRSGTGAVLYHYENNKMRKRLREVGVEVETGTYSCIADIELGIKGINFGCGYEEEHFATCYATLTDIQKGINNFINFYNKFQSKKLHHDMSRRRTKWTTGNTGYWKEPRSWIGDGTDMDDEAYYGANTPTNYDYQNSRFNYRKSNQEACGLCDKMDDSVRWDFEFRCYLCDSCYGVLTTDADLINKSTSKPKEA